MKLYGFFIVRARGQTGIKDQFLLRHIARLIKSDKHESETGSHEISEWNESRKSLGEIYNVHEKYIQTYSWGPAVLILHRPRVLKIDRSIEQSKS